ncbi:MAG TPA: hypothetical protein VF902_00390 [Coriobacteriia bacterium]
MTSFPSLQTVLVSAVPFSVLCFFPSAWSTRVRPNFSSIDTSVPVCVTVISSAGSMTDRIASRESSSFVPSGGGAIGPVRSIPPPTGPAPPGSLP